MNYKKQLEKFDIVTIVNISFVMFAVPLVMGILLNVFAVNADQLITDHWYTDILMVIALFAAGLVTHEGLHAVGFLTLGKCKTKDIRFGISKKQGMLYCTSEKPLTAKAYGATLLIPLVVTGVIPFIVSVVWGNAMLVVLFSILISGAAGDVYMFLRVRKYEANQLILDHPKAPAYYLLYEEGKTPEGYVEATEEQENALVEAMNESPFKERKSWGLTAFFVLLFLCVAVAVLAIIGFILLIIA